MEGFLKSLVLGSTGLFAYGTVFTILVACGLGVPLPEDMALLLGGYLSHRGAAAFPLMAAVGFAGILAGDSMIFFTGRKLGSGAGRHPGAVLGKILTPQKRAKVEEMFLQHGQKIVMIARFIPGLRAAVYFTAGSAGMRYSRFVFWDGVAALASAPLFVYFGYRFGNRLEQLIAAIKRGQLTVIGSLAVVAGLYFGIKWLRGRRQARKAALEAQASDLPSSPGNELRKLVG